MQGVLKLLSEHRAGATLDEINEAIRDVTAGVTDEQKAGTIIITIGIKPLGKGDGREGTVLAGRLLQHFRASRVGEFDVEMVASRAG